GRGDQAPSFRVDVPGIIDRGANVEHQFENISDNRGTDNANQDCTPNPSHHQNSSQHKPDDKYQCWQASKLTINTQPSRYGGVGSIRYTAHKARIHQPD